MHVVFDARSVTGHYPGIGRYGSALSQALARRDDVRLTLLVNPNARRGSFYALPDVPLVDAPAGLTGPAQQWVIPRLLRELGTDLYHSPYYLMPYAPGRPAVVTMHDLIPLLVPGSHGWRFRLIYRAAHRLAARATRRIIAVSKATADDLVHLGLPGDKLAVVHEGVGPEFHPRPPDEIEAVRRKFGLPDLFGLFVGTNKPHKNLGRLAAAWALAGVDWPLVVAGGEDPRYPGGREIAHGSGAALIPLGAVGNGDLPALYSAASLFVMPSLYEGFGLPVLEAMASGAPVICARTSSLLEIAGDAAVLADPREVGDLAQTIARVVLDAGLRADLRARGVAHAARFTWDRAAGHTVEVYREAAS